MAVLLKAAGWAAFREIFFTHRLVGANHRKVQKIQIRKKI